MIKNQKSLRSGTPQANARIDSKAISQPHYSTKIWDGGKVVGEVVGDEFIKKVHSTIHFLRKPPAICFGIESIDQVKQLNVSRIKIFDLDTGIIYRASFDKLLDLGFPVNRRFGEQIGLELKYWTKENTSGNFQLFLWGEQ